MTDNPDEKSTAIEEDATDDAATDDAATDDAVTEQATVPADDAPTDDEPADDAPPADVPPTAKRVINDWAATAIFGLIPALALTLVLAAGWLAYTDNSSRLELAARKDAVQAAKDSTIALLSYQPDKVDEQLKAARDRLTGAFKDQYVDLTNNVVIPGAKQKQISAVATVPQAASVSAGDDTAVVLVFINQTVVVGGDAPTDTASSVRVTLEKVGGAWLISKFDPI